MTSYRHRRSPRPLHARHTGEPIHRLDQSDAEKFESGRRGGAAIAALLRADGPLPQRAAPAQDGRGEGGSA